MRNFREEYGEWALITVLSQTMFLKAIRGFISVSHRRELSTLLEFFNLVQHENQWRNSQFYYLRQNRFYTLVLHDRKEAKM